MVPVFHGTCAVCQVGLPPGRRPSRPRTICHSKECAREVNRYGARVRAARRKRSSPAPPKTEHRCPRCGQVKPLTGEYRYVITRADDGSVVRYDAWCKPCRREYQRTDGLTPEELEDRRARNREKDRRRAARIAADPQRLERERAKRRAQKRRQQAKKPDLARDAQRRYRAKLATDPKRLEARREAERMRYRLRREKEGKAINVRPGKDVADEPVNSYLPVAPLVPFIERWLARQPDGEEVAFTAIGVESRSMRGWRPDENGKAERERIRFDVADAVLTGLGLNWWDVWTGEDGKKAEPLWEGPVRRRHKPLDWDAYKAKRKATREARKARRAERQAA